MNYLKHSHNYLDAPINIKAAADYAYEDKMAFLNSFKKNKEEALMGNPMAQYRLAQSFPKNSQRYLTWMEKAAHQGLTNAMLALAESYAKKGDIQKSAFYARAILNSEDSFMKIQIKALIEHSPKLNAELTSKTIKTSALSLFANRTSKKVDAPAERINLVY